MDAPDEVVTEAIRTQICRCKMELAQKKEIIHRAEALIAELTKNQ